MREMATDKSIVPEQSPIRVVQVLGRLDFGGAETMIMNLYRQIDRSQVQFDFILHTEEECAYSQEVRSLGGRIFSVPAFSAKTAIQYRRAWRRLLGAHPEWKILHSHIRSSAALYLPIAKKLGIRTIVHSHNTASGSGISALVKTLLQYPLRFQADVLFACSKMAGEWLYGKRACLGDNFYLLCNAIDTGRFVFEKQARMDSRRALGLSEDTFVLGHVGRFEEQKNHTFLITILEQLVKSQLVKKPACQEPKFCLLLIGEGKLQESIKQQVQELGLQEQVRFLGARADVDQLLLAMDAFVFPSLFEGLPVTLIEAQATGLPVIASDRITREVILTKLVKQISLSVAPEEWAGQIKDILDGKETKEKVREKVREKASALAIEQIKKAGYDIETTANWLQNFYLEQRTFL